MRNFIQLLGTHKWEYAALVAFTSLILGAEALIQPLLMKAIFDSVTSPESFRAFLPLGLFYLALGVVVNVLAYFAFIWKVRVDNKIILDVSTSMLHSFYSVSYNDLLAKGSGYYVARIRADVKDGLIPMLSTVRDIIVGIVSLVMLVTVLAIISWVALAVLVVLIPLCSIVSAVVSKRIHSLTQSERDYEAAITDVLTRSVTALKTVVGFSLTSAVTSQYTATVNSGLEWSFKRFRMVRLLQVAGDMTRVLSDTGSIFVGAFLVISGQMTVGSFVAFMNAFWRSSSTLFMIINKFADLHSYSATVERIVEFQQIRPSGRGRCEGDGVILESVSFSYSSSVLLDKLDLNISAGERVLIVGENGSGKTTLANIISGLLEPSSGRVTLPRRVSSATLPTHFPPTRIDSLGIDGDILGRFGLGSEELRSVRPDFLSVGQQHKLAIAMVLSMDAELYVLDEPMANLDVDSRDIVMNEIMDRTKNATLIVIAHETKSFSNHFDRIVRLGRELSAGDQR